jgi:indolepyruvate ferredoxin oxidoreductase alpha subunit
MRILEEKGKKVILLGNEAIVRGALEAGVKFATTYPGTPASEIGDTFSQIAKQLGIYFEYSTNEKVALEAAAGASFSGLKSIVSFKNFGLNVASDSFFPVAYFDLNASLVIVVADDPNCFSSAQSEQDSRHYAFLAHVPMIEPSSPQECKDFTKIAFEISEKFKIPVLIRLTTRVSHTRGVVLLGEIEKKEVKGYFKKDEKYFNLAPKIIELHKKLLEKMEKIKEFSEKTEINFIVEEKARSSLGIITSGISFNYVLDALEDLKVKVPVLKLSFTNPLPEKKIGSFLKRFKKVLVVEELDDILEEKIKAIAKDSNPKVKVYGKDLIPKAGELSQELILLAIAKILGKNSNKIEEISKKYKQIEMARRFPVMCPGCPHRATFYAVKKVAKDAVFGGDIGCYMLGILPPLNTLDFIVSMGAGEGIVHGIKKATNQKAIAFIGDSTFFHAGIPALINMVFNKSNPLIIILDNGVTAMTGHQPHPGSGRTGIGEETKKIDLENLVKACGVENVKVVDPFNLKEMEESVKEFLEKDSVSVIIARRYCQLLAVRDKKKEGIKIPKFEISREKCTKCGICLNEFACPAIKKEGGDFVIDEELCTGCAVCFQVCPYRAIRVKE